MDHGPPRKHFRVFSDIPPVESVTERRCSLYVAVVEKKDALSERSVSKGAIKNTENEILIC